MSPPCAIQFDCNSVLFQVMSECPETKLKPSNEMPKQDDPLGSHRQPLPPICRRNSSSSYFQISAVLLRLHLWKDGTLLLPS